MEPSIFSFVSEPSKFCYADAYVNVLIESRLALWGRRYCIIPALQKTRSFSFLLTCEVLIPNGSLGNCFAIIFFVLVF